ncbi:MAG: hypothetical protein K0S08_495 [Gammaproteobacteria bacterium]|jgi:hypothetical protein|nr:hypothetical protein [Gammaproteobacteria bacterium]
MMPSKYFVEFISNDEEKNQAGFDVCLSIASLDLPLCIICQKLNPQLQSLKDFDMAEVYERSMLSEAKYQTLKQTGKFFLHF